jgi:hypothetical protein
MSSMRRNDHETLRVRAGVSGAARQRRGRAKRGRRDDRHHRSSVASWHPRRRDRGPRGRGARLDRGRTADAGKGYGKVAESPDLCGEESALGQQKGPSFNQSCARLRQDWSSVEEKSSWAARSTPGATRRRPSRPCRTHDRGLPAPWPGPSAPPARPTVPPAQPASRAARPTTPRAQPARPLARRARPPTAPRRPAGWTRRTPDEARPAPRHAEPGLWRGRPALERGKPDPWQPLETRKVVPSDEAESSQARVSRSRRSDRGAGAHVATLAARGEDRDLVTRAVPSLARRVEGPPPGDPS